MSERTLSPTDPDNCCPEWMRITATRTKWKSFGDNNAPKKNKGENKNGKDARRT